LKLPKSSLIFHIQNPCDPTWVARICGPGQWERSARLWRRAGQFYADGIAALVAGFGTAEFPLVQP
jgi:hypothetical protein